MFRTVLTASAFALIASAALAQDDAQSKPAEAADAMGMTSDTPKMMMVEPVKLDFNALSTQEDVRKFGEKEFALADANKDGKLDQAEFTTYATTYFAPDSHAMSGDHDMSDSSMAMDDSSMADSAMAEGDMDAEAKAETPEALFAALSDGKDAITEKQFVKARLDTFKKVDANKDNKLDDSEKEAFTAIITGHQPS